MPFNGKNLLDLRYIIILSSKIITNYKYSKTHKLTIITWVRMFNEKSKSIKNNFQWRR